MPPADNKTALVDVLRERGLGVYQGKRLSDELLSAAIMSNRLDQLEWLKNNEEWILYEISISPAHEHDWLYRELQLIRDIKKTVTEKEDE